MMVAGRDIEINLLQEMLLTNQSEFVAMYGRRRIGKTYLIRQVYEKHIVFDVAGLHEENMEQQLENFYINLSEQLNILFTAGTPSTWLQAFSLLKKYIDSIKSRKKKVIFFDEISWFDTPRSGFLAALDNFWNMYCSKRNDIVLVICGSAASWVINKVINNKGGLHNRITRAIQLMPFTLQETAAYLKMLKVSLTLKDIVQLYMCVGGVPFYLKDIKPGQSVTQIIDMLFFKKNAILKNEFSNLYASLFKNAAWHIAIVKALAKVNKGLTRQGLLQLVTFTSGGGFSNTIHELIQCGFVQAHKPFGKTKEDWVYRLCDEFTLFYFKFLVGNIANQTWGQLGNKHNFAIWSGYAFENFCIKHVAQLKATLGIKGVLSTDYAWVNKGTQYEDGTQIDLLIDREDNCINICEMKFCDNIYQLSKTQAAHLLQKVQVYKSVTKTKKNIFVTLITPYGAKQNEHVLSVITNNITINDLFASK
jgi:uncharacterized protein